MASHPSILWAERPDIVYLTVDVQDAKDVVAKVSEPDSFHFSCVVPDGTKYECDLQFHDEIVESGSKIDVRDRNVRVVVKKKNESEDYWNHLLKNNEKRSYVKVDWNMWKDPDEVDAGEDLGAGFGDMGGMMGGMGGGMPGMGAGMGGGMGGMDLSQLMQGMGGMGGAMPGMGGMGGGMPGMGGMGGAMPGMGGMPDLSGIDMSQFANMANQGGDSDDEGEAISDLNVDEAPASTDDV